jgi:dTMP kinase
MRRRPRGRRGGVFITFEGIEGSGKSTQLAHLASWLRRGGVTCTVTREPGGTRAGNAIRSLFLGPSGRGLDPWSELFLVEAARAQHLTEVVRPALTAGHVVLCDRFTDSTLAYQGYGRGLPLPVIRRLHRLPALSPAPDLTLLFDLAVAEGLARAGGRNRAGKGGRLSRRLTRLDDESAVFHRRVRAGFLAIARAERKRIVTIPARGSVEAVAALVRGRIAAQLDLTEEQVGAARPARPRAHDRRKGGGTARSRARKAGA